MAGKIVIAIGGNSIIRPGEKGTIQEQWDAADETCGYIARIIQAGNQVVITHGNGPQIGNILLRSELSRNQLPTLPLDVCGADSQGAMGYMIQQLLDKELKLAGILEKRVVTLITQVEIDDDDPAFKNPSKPIGPFYSKEEAEKHKLEDKWDIAEDANRGYRRVVASPIPKRIIEEDAITSLVRSGYIVIAAGGGGLPVVVNPDGSLSGRAAVIDKDLASSLLAASIGADTLLISTAVPHVLLNFGTPEERAIETMTIDLAQVYASEGHFAKGSMLPKIQAGCEFVRRGGKQAIITSPEHMLNALEGKAGTRIVSEAL
ncbi:MAG: carbamate kinase [Spirochaetia bacterium]